MGGEELEKDVGGQAGSILKSEDQTLPPSDVPRLAPRESSVLIWNLFYL